ncbi:unnamed protein product, partial [Coccothraustes coccothraustes]
ALLGVVGGSQESPGNMDISICKYNNTRNKKLSKQMQHKGGSHPQQRDSELCQ